MIELYLLLAILVIAAYVLYKSSVAFNLELENRRFAEILLPIVRLINLDSSNVSELMCDFNNDPEPDEIIQIVRKHAWRNNIRICEKETELCYRLMRELPLDEEQKKLLSDVGHLLQQVRNTPDGLIIDSKICDK